MFNESVKNFMMGDVSGLSNQVQASAAARKAESGAGDSLGGTGMVFASEVKRIYESELTVVASRKENAAPKKAIYTDDKDENAFAASDFTNNRLDQANEIIANALAKISDLLGLPEDTKLDSAHALQFDPECMDQLAHIMIGVDHALELLGAVSPDVHIEISVRKFVDVGLNSFPFSQLKNSGEVAEFASGLRMARSHIELGLNMLNMRDVMAEKIVSKGGDPVTFGMIQAVNPAELGMSISDTAQVFSGLIREDMATAMERLRMITSGQAEMTELEKAALNMGAIKSGILTAAITNHDEPLAAFDFTNVNLPTAIDNGAVTVTDTNINTDINADTPVVADAGIGVKNNIDTKIDADTGIDTAVKADVNTDAKNDTNASIKATAGAVINANGDDADIAAVKNVIKNVNAEKINIQPPNIKMEADHASDVTGIKTENVKADVKASGNAETDALALTSGKTYAAIDDFDLPISVREAAHNKIRESVEAANWKASISSELLPGKYFFAAANDGADVPVSVTDPAVNKKSIAGDVNINTPSGANLNSDIDNRVNTQVNTQVNTNSNSVFDGADIAKNETAAPKTAAADKQLDIPLSAGESVRNGVSTHAEKPIGIKADNNVNIDSGVKADINVKADGGVRADINAGVYSDIHTNANNAKPAAAESPSVKFSAVGGDAAEVPVSVTASAEPVNKKSTPWHNAGVSAEKRAAFTSVRAVQFETPDNTVNKSADAPAGHGVNTNAGAGVDVGAAPARSTESGVGMAFADAGEYVADNDASGGGDAGIDGGDQNVAQIDVAESKASQVIDKAERAANAFSRLENEMLIRQLTERMYQAARNGVHEIRMTLRPESLGEMRMSIRVQGDVVTARMQVENRQVKSIVESNMQSLKDDLEKHNLKLDGFSVDVGTDSDESSRQAWREMAEASMNSANRRFRPDTDGSSDDPVGNDNADPLGAALGSDTGRRFGSNTFEYFI